MASSAPLDDVCELLRRIKVNELLGNYDAHVKNFSLLHGTDGSIRLSPAYDIVAYAAWLPGSGHALNFYPDQPKRASLTPAVLRRLANIWTLPEKRLRDVVVETVDRAMRAWPEMVLASVLEAGQKRRLLAHLEHNAGVQAWRRRNPAR